MTQEHDLEVMRLEIKRVLAETQASITEAKAELKRWVMVAGVLQTTLVIGVLLRVAKLI